MDEKLNIYQKLAKIRKPVEVLKKNKSGYGYKYVTEDEILAQITGMMTKYGVSLIPSIVRGSLQATPHSYERTKVTKGGDPYQESVNEFYVKADMTWTWVNDDDPEEKIEIDWALVGDQGDVSQAFGSGLTYSSRYFLLKYFQIATPDDDPDNWRSKQKEAEGMEEKIIASKIIDEIDSKVQGIVSSRPDEKPKIIDLIKKYVKKNGKPTADYFSISKIEDANSLLAAINDFSAKLS